MPQISIIVPIYNVDKYLDRCMQSLLNQTLKDIEIILVDDGSLDKCPEMCYEYSKKDNRIKVIHKQNAGLGYARNSGLEIATGEYVAFIDSDDYVDLHMFEKMYEEAISANYDAVFCGVNCQLQNMKFIKKFDSERLLTNNDILNYLGDMIANNVSEKNDRNECMSVWNAIYKRQIIIDNHIKFVSEREFVSEDIIFNFCFLFKSKKIRKIPDALYYYCNNPQSLSRCFAEEKIWNTIKLYNKLLGFIDCEEKKFLKNKIIRLFIGYNLSYVKKIQESNLSLKKKKELFLSISNLEEWRTIKSEYEINKMPYLNRIKIFLLNHKLFYLNLIFYKIKKFL